MVVKNRVKKHCPQKRQQLSGKPLGSTNPESKKIADFSRGRRTSVLTFLAPYSGEDGSTREHYPAMQVVMLPRFLQNKCHHPAPLVRSLNTFVWHPRNRKHMTIAQFHTLGPQGMESLEGYKHPKGPPQLCNESYNTHCKVESGWKRIQCKGWFYTHEQTQDLFFKMTSAKWGQSLKYSRLPWKTNSVCAKKVVFFPLISIP